MPFFAAPKPVFVTPNFLEDSVSVSWLQSPEAGKGEKKESKSQSEAWKGESWERMERVISRIRARLSDVA